MNENNNNVDRKTRPLVIISVTRIERRKENEKKKEEAFEIMRVYEQIR